MAAIAGTLRWTGKLWSATRKRIPFVNRARVVPMTFADTQKKQRDLFGTDRTPCTCAICRRARAEEEEVGPRFSLTDGVTTPRSVEARQREAVQPIERLTAHPTHTHSSPLECERDG